MVGSFVGECNHHNAVGHLLQRDILCIADKANAGNHGIGFTSTGTSANDNVLFGGGMFNLILLKVELALLTELLECAFLGRTVIAISDCKGSCFLIKGRTQHAHGTMEAHEHIPNRFSQRSMAYLLIKCNFDIVAIAN